MHPSSILIIEVITKGTVILLAGYGGAALLARSSAAHRSWWWLGVFVTLLFLPLVFVVRPLWSLPMHVEVQPAGFVPVASGSDAKPPDVSIPVGRSADEHYARLSVRMGKWLLAAYGCGAALVLGFRLLGSCQLRRLRRGSVEDREAQIVIDRWRQSARVRRRVRVCADVRAAAPMTWGIWRPVILLPDTHGERTTAEFRAALQHEFAHIRHHDAARRWVGVVVAALWWPHPLIWAALRAWNLEQERACDDAVLNGGSDPVDYAQQLLEVARSAHFFRYQNAGALIMATESGLETRLRSVVSRQIDRSPAPAGAMLRIGALTFAAVCIGVLIQALPATGAPSPRRDEGEAISVQKRAEATIIPVLEFNRVTPAVALQKVSTLTGLKVSFIPKEDDEANLSVSLTNVPASEALRYVAALADLKISYKDDGVYVQSGPDLGAPILITPAAKAVRIRFIPAPPDGSIGNGADFSELHYINADKPGVLMLMAHAGIGDSFPVAVEHQPKLFDVAIVGGDDDSLKLEIRAEQGAKQYDLKRDGVVSVQIAGHKFTLAYPSITGSSTGKHTTDKAMIIVNRLP